MRPHLSRISLELEPKEIQRLLHIVLDEDCEEALRFLKECLDKKLKDRLRPHCVPVFEANYSPRQKDDFAPIATSGRGKER